MRRHADQADADDESKMNRVVAAAADRLYPLRIAAAAASKTTRLLVNAPRSAISAPAIHAVKPAGRTVARSRSRG
jgi:hypothetical protein